jgi:hypothetical protein
MAHSLEVDLGNTDTQGSVWKVYALAQKNKRIGWKECPQLAQPPKQANLLSHA